MRADQARQTGGTAGGRNHTELHFGETEHRLGMIARDTIAARQCQFEAATETGAVNGGDDRFGGVGDALHQQLAVLGEARCLFHGAECDEFLDVGAGNEDVGLARTHDDCLDDVIGLEALHQLLEFPADRLADLVDRIVRRIEGDNGHAVAALECEGTHATRSSTIANPIPPCAQIEISPNCTSRRTISFDSVVTSREPVAPKG